MSGKTTFRIAAVQAAPVFLDGCATAEKAVGLIHEAKGMGADVVVFPEAFIPAYPVWVWFIPAARTKALRELYARLHDNSVSIPDETTRALCAAARKAGVQVVMGINERNTEASGATVCNTMLYIGPDGEIQGRHRKLVPTTGERIVWGRGDGDDLSVHDTPYGKIAGLICWENYMPLARYALYAQGVQIYAAPTWDHGEPWTSTLRHIAKEGRVFVIGCCTAMRRDDIPDALAFKSEFLGGASEWINPGESAIIDPDGKIIAGPAVKEETILVADVARDDLTGPRFQLDVAGHYARPDVFEFVYRGAARPMMKASPPAAQPGDAHEAP